ncbi:MAG TPA: hypothetical protein VMN36_12240 [Verrucomicrobiales bacterium]|nr:hypothetical protein [Verrucomicrobiales bacterium]
MNPFVSLRLTALGVALLGCASLTPASAALLINEGHINPPGGGDVDVDYQYIELISLDENGDPTQEAISDVQLLIVDSSGGSVGNVQVVLELDGLETGANGLLLIGLGYDSPPGGVWAGQIDPNTAVADLEDLASRGNYGSPLRDPVDIGPKGGISLLLVRNYTQRNGYDLDTSDNGSLNRTPWDLLLDSAGYGDAVRAYETDLGLIAGFTPDNFSRLGGNASANDPSAWYGGNITGGDLDNVNYSTNNIFGPIIGKATPGSANVGAPEENTLLINEVVLDHTTSELYPEGSLQFVELINTEGGPQPTTGLSLILVSTHSESSAGRGEVLEVWRLDTLATGNNGLLLLGHDYPEFVGWGDVPNATAIADPDGMGADDIPSANGFSLLLVRDLDSSITPRSGGVSGTDLDADNDGSIDLPPPWNTGQGTNGILDSVGASELTDDGVGIEPGGETYAEVDLAQPAPGGGYMPDAVCRKRSDARANAQEAWYGGTLSGQFAGNSPTNITFSYQNGPGQGFFGGFQGAVTPGAANLNAANLIPDSQAGARLLLNEVHIDPPGDPDGNAEFIEILSSHGETFSTRNIQILILNTTANGQEVIDLWNLEGLSTGPNGLLLLGDNYDDESAAMLYPALRHRLVTHREDPQGLNGSDLRPNATATILLVEGFTGSTGNQLDPNGDGEFDSTPWTQILDSVSIGSGPRDPSIAQISAPFLPQTVSRIPGNTQANSADAWTGGTIDGTLPGSILYDEFFGSFASEASPGAYNLAASRPSAAGRILLNEIHANPPGGDSNYEFIEILATDLRAASTNDLTLVVIETSGQRRGKVLENWSLDGLGSGSNGLLLLGNNYTDPAQNPWTQIADPGTAFGDPDGLGNGDIGPNESLTILLVQGYRGRVGLDLDANDDGTMDDPPPWTVIQGTNDDLAGSIDSLGYRLWVDNDPPPGGDWGTITYARADVSQVGYQPDNASRIRGDVRSNLTAAWYGGDIAGNSPTSVNYSASSRFNLDSPDLAGARATPGNHNFGADAGGPGDDNDGDGMTNAQEELAGTDPNDPADYFRITAASREGNFTTIIWTSKPGKIYAVEFSPSMEAASWTPVIEVPSAGDGVTSFVATIEQKEGYYRVRLTD